MSIYSLTGSLFHYNDVIMSVMVFQITRLAIVYSTVYWHRSKKISKLRVTSLCEGNSPVTGEFPAERARNAENVSTWWRHRAMCKVGWASSVIREIDRDMTNEHNKQHRFYVFWAWKLIRQITFYIAILYDLQIVSFSEEHSGIVWKYRLNSTSDAHFDLVILNHRMDK